MPVGAQPALAAPGALPLSTTLVTITRVPPNAQLDGYDLQPSPVTIASGVRAVIWAPSGSQQYSGGDRTVVTWRMTCDVADMRTDDTVTDSDGNAYRVVWARTRVGLGLSHLTAGLVQVAGAS